MTGLFLIFPFDCRYLCRQSEWNRFLNTRRLMNNARRYPGGAAAINVRYALGELPVTIDSSVLLNKICTSRTMWGFGSAERSHFAVFRRPHKPHIMNVPISQIITVGLPIKCSYT